MFFANMNVKTEMETFLNGRKRYSDSIRAVQNLYWKIHYV